MKTVHVHAALGLGLALAACGPHVDPVGPNGVSASDAIMRIHTNVADAGLWVDGKFIATVDALHGGIALGAGHHRLELRHDDYFSNYLELDTKAAERRTLELPLSPILP